MCVLAVPSPGVSLNHLVTERLADGVGFGSTISNSVIFGSTSASSCSASLACHAMVRTCLVSHAMTVPPLARLLYMWMRSLRRALGNAAVQAPGDVRGVGCNSVFGPTWRHVGVVSSQYLNKGKLCISDVDGGGGESLPMSGDKGVVPTPAACRGPQYALCSCGFLWVCSCVPLRSLVVEVR